MLALVVVVLLFVILKSLRVADWLALIAAFGATYYAQSHLPALDVGPTGATTIAVIAALVLTPFWLGPVLIYFTQKQNASPSFETFDPQAHCVPESMAVAIGESESALLASGFIRVGDYFQSGFMQNMTARVGLFARASSRQQAIVVGMYMNNEPAKIIAHYVEILAKYSDGRTLLVNNSPMLGSYAPVAGKTVEQFPDVRDPRRLVRLHERLMEEMGALGDTKEFEPGIDGAAYLAEGLVRELDQQLPTGYLRVDAAANAYRPTIKGALLMTWAQVPPISTIRMKRVRRRAAQLIERLGVTEPDENPASVPALQKKVAWPAVGLLMAIVVYVAGADTVARDLSFESERVAPMTLPANFAVPADFPGAVKALEALTGSVAEQLVVIDSLGFPVQTDGATLGVEAARADSLLAAAQGLFLERGFFLFRHEPHYGIGGKPDEIGLVPLADQFAVVQRVGTNGLNFDLSNGRIIAWLRELERDAPFVLTGIGYDHVEGRFLGPIGPQAEAIAERLNRFCPDVVHQGTGSVRELANEIGRLNTFFCWWD